MAENTGNNNSTAADTVSAVVKGAGASKAGKALLGKAAGPYGTLAVSAWENRKTVFAILCALLFLLMLPVLFIIQQLASWYILPPQTGMGALAGSAFA